MKNFFLIIAALSFSFTFNCFSMKEAPYIITFYIRPLSEKPNSLDKNLNKFQSKLQIPGKFNNSLIKHHEQRSQLLSGIYSTYAGYSAFTDTTGQITFPRYSPTPEVNLLITSNIQPILQPTAPKTIRSLALTKQETNTGEEAYKFYKLKLIEDPQAELYYWHITQEKLPKLNIPDNTIIIYANPKHIFVPTGSITDKSNVKLNQNRTNLVLPDVYASSKIEKPLNALKFLKLKKLFEPVKKAYKYEPDLSRYMVDIQTKYV